ncbi:hypothetical protein HK105_201640 [Polyrhizophydium stewartii]|uniref:L domain-like protein n=1 Tax=Polyrhizophydium stewartii TaxID=2732419 RepID=A0ABR4NH29_9FUNG
MADRNPANCFWARTGAGDSGGVFTFSNMASCCNSMDNSPVVCDGVGTVLQMWASSAAVLRQRRLPYRSRAAGLRLNGTLPADVSQLAQTTYIDLSGNNLQGSIPQSLIDLVQLGFLDLSNNRLGGTIPTISNPGIETIKLANNTLRGALTINAPRLRVLDVSNTEVSSVVGDLSALESCGVASTSVCSGSAQAVTSKCCRLASSGPSNTGSGGSDNVPKLPPGTGGSSATPSAPRGARASAVPSAAIAGGAAGGVVFIAIVIALVVFLVKRRPPAHKAASKSSNAELRRLELELPSPAGPPAVVAAEPSAFALQEVVSGNIDANLGQRRSTLAPMPQRTTIATADSLRRAREALDARTTPNEDGDYDPNLDNIDIPSLDDDEDDHAERQRFTKAAAKH